MLRERMAYAPELLDEQRHDPRELEQSLDQVAEVNRLLGGRRAVWHALHPLLQAGTVTRILDIGTGSADIPLFIANRAPGGVDITATDVHPQMREIAARRTAARREISVRDADALALPFEDDSFDVVLLSLTLHHFEDDEQQRALREAARVARRAVIINELERCRANWWGSQLLAHTRWRGNRLTRHDGPLSVLRAFTLPELHDIATRAGLRVESAGRCFFFRIVLVADTRRA